MSFMLRSTSLFLNKLFYHRTSCYCSLICNESSEVSNSTPARIIRSESLIKWLTGIEADVLLAI